MEVCLFCTKEIKFQLWNDAHICLKIKTSSWTVGGENRNMGRRRAWGQLFFFFLKGNVFLRARAQMAELRAVLFFKKKNKTNERDTFSSLTACLTSAEGTFHQVACTLSRAGNTPGERRPPSVQTRGWWGVCCELQNPILPRVME